MVALFLPSRVWIDTGKVLYTGTFSKSLSRPEGWPIWWCPKGRSSVFRDQVIHLPGAGNPVLQSHGCGTLWKQGHFTCHLGKMRKAYAQRYGYLAQALACTWETDPGTARAGGGMHLLARLGDDGRQRVGSRRRRRRRLALHPASEWEIRPGAFRGVLMGLPTLRRRNRRTWRWRAALWPVVDRSLSLFVVRKVFLGTGWRSFGLLGLLAFGLGIEFLAEEVVQEGADDSDDGARRTSSSLLGATVVARMSATELELQRQDGPAAEAGADRGKPGSVIPHSGRQPEWSCQGR